MVLSRTDRSRDQVGLRLPRTAHVWGVDPGLNGTGWCHLSWDAARMNPNLLQAGVLTVPSSLGEARFEDRAHHLCTALCSIYRDASPAPHAYVVIEMPEHFGSAGSSMGWKKGDLQKLTFLVGMLAGMVCPERTFTVPVHTWKGQLPKPVVTERIQSILGRDVCAKVGVQTHAWDALGIGLWAMGRF